MQRTHRQEEVMNQAIADRFITRLLKLQDEGGIDSLRPGYADSVDYYGKTTPLNDVIKDKQNYRRRWPYKSQTLMGHVTVSELQKDKRWIFTYRTSYDVSNKQSHTGGEALETIGAIYTNGGLKIFKEDSQTLSRTKTSVSEPQGGGEANTQELPPAKKATAGQKVGRSALKFLKNNIRVNGKTLEEQSPTPPAQ